MMRLTGVHWSISYSDCDRLRCQQTRLTEQDVMTNMHVIKCTTKTDCWICGQFITVTETQAHITQNQNDTESNENHFFTFDS